MAVAEDVVAVDELLSRLVASTGIVYLPQYPLTYLHRCAFAMVCHISLRFCYGASHTVKRSGAPCTFKHQAVRYSTACAGLVSR